MKYTLITLLSLLLLSTWSCKKDKLTDIDQINFGHSNVSWGPDCQAFQLKPGELRTASEIPCGTGDTSALVYDVLLSSDKYALAEQLLHDLPEEIFNSTETNFTTNCVDCGGYYLRIKMGAAVKELTLTDVLNSDWPNHAKKAFMLLSQTVNDLK